MPTLAYCSPERTGIIQRLHLGRVSLSLNVIVLLAIPVTGRVVAARHLRGGEANLIFDGLMVLEFIAVALGTVAALQPKRRLLAIGGIFCGLLGFIAIPMFMYA